MKYNLGEEEDLTHHGTSLSTIEKFEKPMSDDDSDSDDDRNGGKLGGNVLSSLIYGCKYLIMYIYITINYFYFIISRVC